MARGVLACRASRSGIAPGTTQVYLYLPYLISDLRLIQKKISSFYIIIRLGTSYRPLHLFSSIQYIYVIRDYRLYTLFFFYTIHLCG